MYVPTIAHNALLKTCKLHQAVLLCKSTYLDNGGVAGIYPAAGSSPFYKKFFGGSSHAGLQTLYFMVSSSGIVWIYFCWARPLPSPPKQLHCKAVRRERGRNWFQDCSGILESLSPQCHVNFVFSAFVFVFMCFSVFVFVFVCFSLSFFCDLLFLRPFVFVLVLFSCSSQFPIWKGALPSNAEHLGGSRECQNSQISPPKISSPPDLFISL